MFHVKHFEKNKIAVLSAHRGERGKIMSFAKKYNKGKERIFDIDISDFRYMSMEDVFKNFGSNIIKVDGLYINTKSDYGDHPVAINVDDGLLIDLPQHMTEVVKEILKDSESISLIKKGAVGLSAQKYTSKKYKKTCYSAEWVDL